ncbi:hypothetical protein [Haloechinothrix halophila]|uniref:hypothetical protein n=1 Tax=Haloechinothrix halophila TaxID=1069073 RepID=UPI000403CE89|nr:hypothetical protein [Haloechinothrix halophila]
MTALRRMTAAVFALSLGFGFVGMTAALAEVPGAEPGTMSGASVTKTGWWWKTNDSSETPPEVRPVTDAVPPPPPPKNVPEDTLPVAAHLGEPDKVSAIEFDFDAEPGALVTSFQLSLRESEEPGANAAADAEETSVVACEVTEAFWTDGEAANWPARPDYDDGGCQKGVRDDKGVWTFDLTSFAAKWLGTDQRASGSVVLVEDVDAPVTFQAVFNGPELDGVGTSLESTPGTDAGGSGTGDSGRPDIDVSSQASGAGSVPPASGGVPTASSAGMDAVPQAADAPTPAAQAQQQPPQPQAAGNQPFLIAPSAVEAVPAGVWVLAPLVLGVAYLMMLALGPAGEPNAHLTRRGVSKALERLRSTGTKTAEGVR